MIHGSDAIMESLLIQGYYRWVDLEVIYLVPSCHYDFDWLTNFDDEFKFDSRYYLFSFSVSAKL